MKIIVLVIGIATGVLDQLSRARGASYSSPASAPDSGWYRPGANHREPWAGIRELMVAYRRA